ncbi:TrmB family transcriptional regulator [Clostridium guangxiense]|uniref:TrmB family transcriptional regulator n=1 Tax=Clostridium guangxiense TaxID=1662055 RepID=UPI001E2BB754|nr:TrmB family transcriptional regulator [Clostridium guangxiense]MCD2347831.1 TrmB family transcriptional regulator [Clostridium guangxiense]
MDQILDLLENLNFTKTEGLVYVDLLKNYSLTGYQIAKNLNISRSSVYSALDNLYKRGVVFLLNGNSQMYIAEKPSTLINKMKSQFMENADLLESKLNRLEKYDLEERYVNIEGYDNIISKVKELILKAKSEIYINTDFDLHLFSKEFNEINKRGVRTIVFSFAKLDKDNLPVELYSHCSSACDDKQTRIMLVVDCKTSLIADITPHRDEFLGTFTDNLLLTSIVSEHIHNDIYLLKLKNKYGKDLITEDIKLNTLLENR